MYSRTPNRNPKLAEVYYQNKHFGDSNQASELIPQFSVMWVLKPTWITFERCNKM